MTRYLVMSPAEADALCARLDQAFGYPSAPVLTERYTQAVPHPTDATVLVPVGPKGEQRLTATERAALIGQDEATALGWFAEEQA